MSSEIPINTSNLLHRVKIQTEGLEQILSMIDHFRKGGFWSHGEVKIIFNEFRETLLYYLEFQKRCDWDRLVGIKDKHEFKKELDKEVELFEESYKKEMWQS